MGNTASVKPQTCKPHFPKQNKEFMAARSWGGQAFQCVYMQFTDHWPTYVCTYVLCSITPVYSSHLHVLQSQVLPYKILGSLSIENTQ